MGDLLTRAAPSAGLRIRYGQESPQFGELRVPSGGGPHPLVIAIHGGYWRARYELEHLGHLCTALTRAGYATWSLEYRRLGQPGGGYPGTFQDVARGADFVRTLAAEHRLDVNRVTALGHSAGGTLALWLGARRRLPAGSGLAVIGPLGLQRIIALAPVSDLTESWRLKLSQGVVGELLGGGPETVPGRYDETSPAALLPLGVPQVILHGEQDEDVPFELSVRFVQAAQRAGDPCRLVALAGTGHFELIDPATPQFRSVLGALE